MTYTDEQKQDQLERAKRYGSESFGRFERFNVQMDFQMRNADDSYFQTIENCETEEQVLAIITRPFEIHGRYADLTIEVSDRDSRYYSLADYSAGKEKAVAS